MLKTIWELIKHGRENWGMRTALLSVDGQELNYQDVAEQVISLQSQLRSFGLGRNAPVAVVLPNGLEMALAFMGTACTATAAPLNPNYTESEFAFYLEDIQASAVIVPANSQSSVRRVAEQNGILVLETSAAAGSNGEFLMDCTGSTQTIPVKEVEEEVEEQDVALVLHTSGTTSRPKMVPLTQRNLITSANNIKDTLHLSSSDRSLNVMPLFHIHGLMAGLLAPLLAGGSVVCTPGFRKDEFFDWLDQVQPTYYSAVPTMHQAVLSGKETLKGQFKSSSLRFIRSSSASLPPPVMAALEEAFQAPVIESYGMTEASHQMASNPLPPHNRKPGSVGPAAGPQVAILDVSGAFLPAGERGEICIRGDNVMEGYRNNPSANQASFTDGWFHTGDEGFLDGDGYLFITGRLKEMINRGGEKIIPREVDEIFLDHAAIAQAVTFSIPHKSLGEDVAVAVVLKPGASITEKELRDYALTKLSPEKAPTQVIILDALPKGPTGKLQRIGLHQRLAKHLKPDYLAPRNGIEARLTQLFEQVLGEENIGVLDNFFSLGGDSLKAISLAALIQDEFKVDLKLGTVFREPSVAELAKIIDSLLISPGEKL